MEAIGESITRLSEQSVAIGEITATVSDLADQSNLLSVNAAIEAVQSGEQGKGFGVVAQEIKGLAEQSKRATAAGAQDPRRHPEGHGGAVMATEKGSKSVEQGMKQSEEARESIETLAETVEEAVQAAAQIAASSQQQLVGMDQVATAMESIKVASLQGVAGTRQLEAGAQNLHAVGQKMKQLVGILQGLDAVEELKTGRAILVFRTGDSFHALFLDAVEKVEFSVEVTVLPEAPRIVLGVINWRGTILPVLSMRRRLHLPERPVDIDDRLVVARSRRRRLALLVDEIVRLTSFSDDDAAAADGIWHGMESIAGALKIEADIVLIHDLDAFLDEPEEIALEEALGKAGA